MEGFAVKVGEALTSQCGIAAVICLVVAVYLGWMYSKSRAAHENDWKAWISLAEKRTQADLATASLQSAQTAAIGEIKTAQTAMLSVLTAMIGRNSLG